MHRRRWLEPVLTTSDSHLPSGALLEILVLKWCKARREQMTIWCTEMKGVNCSLAIVDHVCLSWWETANRKVNDLRQRDGG